MEADLSQRKMEQSSGAHQLERDKNSADSLGDQSGNGGSCDSHVEKEYKNRIQNNIDHTADDQDIQRAFGISGCAQDGGSHVIDEYKKYACEIDSQVNQGTIHDLSRCIHEPEHERCCQYPDKCKRDPAGCSDSICIVETCVCGLFFFCACELGDSYRRTRRKTGKEADHKRDDLRGRTAYAGKCFFTHKLSHDHTVYRIIKLLEESAQQDRKEEQQKLLPDDSFCNFISCLTYCFHKIPLFKLQFCDFFLTELISICIIISVHGKSNII